MNITRDLEKLKELKRKLLVTANKQEKIILAYEYDSLGYYLIDTKIIEKEWFEKSYDEIEIDEKKEKKAILRAYQTVFNNLELIEEITSKIKCLHSKYPINLSNSLEYKYVNISKAEIDELIRSFFATMPKDINNLFKKMIDLSNFSCVENDSHYSGLCVNVSFFDYPRIIVQKYDDLLDLAHTFVHEMGHCYENIRNKTNRGIAFYNLFTEVPSILFAKIFNYYLITNSRYQEFSKINLLEWKNTVLVFNYINDYVNKAYHSNCVSFDLEEFNTSLEIDNEKFQVGDDIEEYIDNYGTNILNYGYVISDIIANNLFKEYINNKEVGLRKIDEFITTMYLYSEKEILTRYAFDFSSTEEEVKKLYYEQKKKFYL